MVSERLTPSAVIAVGATELTVGTGMSAVTATNCKPDEQSELVVCEAERHTRT